jgi:phosphatidylglycerophosphate synthase
MFDAKIRPFIDPPLNRLGRLLAGYNVSANKITVLGVVAGLASACAVAAGLYILALVLIFVSRFLDGLDGAVARATAPTDLGGYLDIVGDFVFYVSIPLGFALRDSDNALAAAILIASFTLTGISFLAYAVIAAKHDLQTQAHGKKSFFYSTGLAEGAETIAAFALMCLLPHYFVLIALSYAALCLATVIQRSLSAYRNFAGR